MDTSLTSRFQMLLTLALFLPVIVISLGGESTQINDNVLNWAGAIAFLILDYLLLEFIGIKRLERKFKLLVQVLTAINIFAFIPFLAIVAKYKETLRGFLAIYGLKVSLYMMLWIPVIIAIVLLIQIFFIYNKKK